MNIGAAAVSHLEDQVCVYSPLFLFLALWCLVIFVPLAVWSMERLGLCMREAVIPDDALRDHTFSVLSWNVHRGLGGVSVPDIAASLAGAYSPSSSSLEAIAQFIVESEAQVITGMEFRFYRPIGVRSQCGTAILSRFEILETRQCAFKQTRALSSRSQCALAALLHISDSYVWFVSSHFGSSKSLHTQVGHAFELIDFAKYLRRQPLPSDAVPLVAPPSAEHQEQERSTADSISGGSDDMLESAEGGDLLSSPRSVVEVVADGDPMISPQLGDDPDETDVLMDDDVAAGVQRSVAAEDQVGQVASAAADPQAHSEDVHEDRDSALEVVVAGDLNAPSFSTVRQVLLHYFEDAWAARGRWSDLFGTTHFATRFSFLPRLLRSDYVLLFKHDEGVRTISAQVLETDLSDHHALLASLRLPFHPSVEMDDLEEAEAEAEPVAEAEAEPVTEAEAE
eukprot:CAMPEP_0177682448 /NCGR_PEP_ID=MMETSP0447-20121125/31265_1 /TAXON_ID=0 /ORGANISM="Stygamoeba regulata, Strain BSH-02190019" /LENGTH=452 /DNA_ID=CAMNT_0019191953 /DNA_START=192 /DNA_END=1547 /DNA_ORIENTATION=+